MSRRGPLIFLAVVLALLLPFVLQIVQPFVTPFILASMLAIVMAPAKKSLAERIHRPGLATFLITFATVLLLGIIVVTAGVAITRELSAAYDAVNQRSLEEGGWPAFATNTVDRVVDELATRLPVDKEAIRKEFIERTKAITGYLLSHIGDAVGGVTSGLITFLLVTVFLYVLLRHGEDWIRRLAAMMPLGPRTTASLFKTVNDSVVANVNGIFVVALGQGLLLAIGFWFVGLRSPVLWGVIGGLASIVPMVGALVIWVPIVVTFVLIGAYGKALMLGLWGGLVVGSLDNIVRPFVVGAREKQHPLLIAMAMIGGTYAFGALGILLGPLVISLVAAVLKEMQDLATTPLIETSEPKEPRTF